MFDFGLASKLYRDYLESELWRPLQQQASCREEGQRHTTHDRIGFDLWK